MKLLFSSKVDMGCSVTVSVEGAEMDRKTKTDVFLEG